jgi:DNA polymerase-4
MVPEMIARKIKDGILAVTGLSCSVGIAPNRFLAKIASIHKPNGGHDSEDRSAPC